MINYNPQIHIPYPVSQHYKSITHHLLVSYSVSQLALLLVVTMVTLCRLVRRDGEIVEEIVRKQRQQQINKVRMSQRQLNL